MITLLWLLFSVMPQPSCPSIDYGQVSDSAWEWLLDSGWRGDPTDGAERIYPPVC